MREISYDEFKKLSIFNNFITTNSGVGRLKIRAYAASEALPVAGLEVVVSSIIDNYNVIFFDGFTDASGVVETINLPAPKAVINNMDVPLSAKYLLTARDTKSSREYTFSISMYDGVCVVQNINIILGDTSGS